MERPGLITRPDMEHNHERENTARQIGIATATFYPGWKPLPEGATRSKEDVAGLRGDLAIQMIARAKEQGFQIGVVDGGSSDEFKTVLEDRFGVVTSEERQRGMSPSRRQAFTEVSSMEDVKVVAWTEPEKISVVDNLIKAAKPILEGEADVVVPRRDTEAFATYPDYQADWENRANHDYNSLLKEAGLLPDDAEEIDAWFGVRLMKNDPDIIKIFTHPWELDQSEQKYDNGKMDPELWPNAIFLPVVAVLWRDKALGQSPRVVSVPVDYRHPAEQTAMEQNSPAFEAKREQQYNNIIGATEALVQVLEHDAATAQLYIGTTKE
jgi:hypothetical protein